MSKTFIGQTSLSKILSDFKTRVTTKITESKVTKISDLENDKGYQTESDVQTKATAALDEAKSYIDTTVSNIKDFNVLTVDSYESLPTPAEAVEKTIYLVPIAGSTEGDNNGYTEYYVVNGKWEIFGSTKTDLSGYDTSEVVDQKIENAKATEITDEETTAFINELWADD